MLRKHNYLFQVNADFIPLNLKLNLLYKHIAEPSISKGNPSIVDQRMQMCLDCGREVADVADAVSDFPSVS